MIEDHLKMEMEMEMEIPVPLCQVNNDATDHGPKLVMKSDDSFYELATLDPSEAKRWGGWTARANDGLGLEVRSVSGSYELGVKEKTQCYVCCTLGSCGEERHRRSSSWKFFKGELGKKEAETAEVTITQKVHDISLLDSRATHLESALNDAQVACTEAGTKITSLASERDRLASEVSSLHAGFKDFQEEENGKFSRIKS
ncbi:hypothetical protein Tco_0686773 [Tanacetum coccineum]